MTAPNLYAPEVAAVDQLDRAAFLAAGYLEGGNNTVLGSATSVPAVYGTRYGTATATLATGVANVDFPPVPVTAGQVYSWGLQQQRRDGAARGHRLDLRWFSDASGTTLIPGTITQGAGQVTSAPGTWAKSTQLNATAPTGAVSCRPRLVYLATNTPADGDRIGFDAVQFEQGATLSSEVVAGAPGGYRAKLRTAAGTFTSLLINGARPASTDALIRTQANAPVNAADAAVQAGDLSEFVVVSTFTELRARLAAGQWSRVSSTILCPDQMLVTTSAALYVDAGGKVLRNYASSGATDASFIRTERTDNGTGYLGRPITPSHDLYFGGPGEIGSSSIANTGNIFAVAGDNIVFDGFTTRQWNGGRHTCWIGNNGRARRIRLLGGQASGSGNGGLRYMGGTGFRCIDSHCDSGDDVWQCVPAGALSDPFFSVSIDDAIYLGCTGSSHSGRVCIIGNQDQFDDQNDVGSTQAARMTSSITRVKFIDIVGASSGAALAIQNKSSSGVIQDILYDRVIVRGVTPSVAGQPGAVFLNNVENSAHVMGGIRDVTYVDVEVLDHHRPAIRNGPGLQSGVQRISFVRGRFERGTETPGEPIVELTGGTGWSMDGTVLNRRGSTSTAVRDNADDAPSDLDYTVIDSATGAPPLPPVLDVQATPGTGTVTLSWTITPGTNGQTPTGVVVGRNGVDTNGTGAYSTTDPLGALTNGTYRGSRVFDKLLAGTTYTVTAALAGVTPAVSKSATVTTAGTTPGPSGARLSGASGLNTVPQTLNASTPFGNWRGTPVQMIGTWNDADANTQTGQWSIDPQYWGQFPNNYRWWTGSIDVAVGAIFSGETWAQADAGAYDARWVTMLQKVNASWSGKAGAVHMRFAHEFNLAGAYPWQVAPGQEANFVAAWRRFHGLFQTHMDARHQLVWCPNWDNNVSGLSTTACYPGSAYVDVISVDQYNKFPYNNTLAGVTATMNEMKNGEPRGIETHRQFALAQGKPFALSEWGDQAVNDDGGGGGNSSAYVQQMHAWLTTHQGTGPGEVLYEIYFNVENFGTLTNGASKHQLWPNTAMPLAAAKYAELF